MIKASTQQGAGLGQVMNIREWVLKNQYWSTKFIVYSCLLFQTIAQRSTSRLVAQMRQEGGTYIARVAEWMHSGRPMVVSQKKALHCKHHLSISAMLLPLLYHHCASFGRPVASMSNHCGDHCAFIRRPQQPFNGSASTLPPLSDLFCLYSSFGDSRKAQGLCCSSYTETELFGLKWSVIIVLIIFLVTQRRHKGHSPM